MYSHCWGDRKGGGGDHHKERANAKLARTNQSHTSPTYLVLPKADLGGIVTPCALLLCHRAIWNRPQLWGRVVGACIDLPVKINDQLNQ